MKKALTRKYAQCILWVEIKQLEGITTMKADPNEDFLDTISRLLDRFESRTTRSAEYFKLSDCDGQSPYDFALAQLDAAIGRLKHSRRDMQRLSKHVHQWDENDYCYICGADGRA